MLDVVGGVASGSACHVASRVVYPWTAVSSLSYPLDNLQSFAITILLPRHNLTTSIFRIRMHATFYLPSHTTTGLALLGDGTRSVIRQGCTPWNTMPRDPLNGSNDASNRHEGAGNDQSVRQLASQPKRVLCLGK
jgi:hypothetical protein